MSTTVFLDTVGLLALWDRSDQWHGAAETAFQGILAHRWNCVTTTFVLADRHFSAAGFEALF